MCQQLREGSGGFGVSNAGVEIFFFFFESPVSESVRLPHSLPHSLTDSLSPQFRVVMFSFSNQNLA
jgi:hypothetical protein